MTLTTWIGGFTQWEIILVGFIVGFLVREFISIIPSRKRKPKNFLGLRELIDRRYAQLIEGAKGYHEIVEILNEVEKNAKR